MTPQPTYMEMFSIADCAARLLEEQRKYLREATNRSDSLKELLSPDHDKRFFQILTECPIASLRFVARQPGRLGLVAARVAIWRGKTREAAPGYLDKLHARLAPIDRAREEAARQAERAELRKQMGLPPEPAASAA
jgi:ABC-type transporter Mla subunit MlaD